MRPIRPIHPSNPQRLLVSAAMLLFLFAGMCIQVAFDGHSAYAMLGLALGVTGGSLAHRVSGPPRPPLIGPQ